MDLSSIDPQVLELGVRLTESGARNTGSAISTRIRSAKASKQAQQIETELQDIIAELQEQRAELLQLAHAYKEQVVGQTISDADVSYITTQLLPKVKEFVDQIPDDKLEDKQSIHEVLDASGALISKEALTVLQMLGFNFKRAIGEPLTAVVADMIGSRLKPKPVAADEMQIEGMRLQRMIAQMVQDEVAFKRFRELYPVQSSTDGG